MQTAICCSAWECVPSDSPSDAAYPAAHAGTRRLNERAAGLLDARARAGLLRSAPARAAGHSPAPWVEHEGRLLLGFASNDYLALARDPRVLEAAHAALDRWGTGASAASLLGGRTALHEELEAAMAVWLRQPAALLLPSGYQANLAAQALVAERDEVILHDRLNHASLLEATRLARARLLRYRHADALDCAERLASLRPALLVTESVFGMDGDAAPLAQLGELAAAHGVPLLVDEAHAVGVLGPDGAGLAADLAPICAASVVIAPFGKALASQGACIAGPAAWIDAIRQMAPSAVYSTALAPAAAAAALAALHCIRREPERRRMLQQRAQQFRQRVSAFARLSAPSAGAVVSLHVGDAHQAVRLERELADRGFRVPAIRPPTVPAGTARLRVSLSAAHEPDHVDALADALAACWPATDPQGPAMAGGDDR
jgi:8-amino-7-oxononanoate synthase